MALDEKVVKGVMAKARLILTHRQYAIFESHYSFEVSVSNLAAEFGCSESNIYKLLQRAKAQMKVNWR